MSEEVQSSEETSADSTETVAQETPAVESAAPAKTVADGPTTDAGTTAKTALEALNEGIGEAFTSPKRITPKEEETPEVKEAAAKAVAEEDAAAAEKGQVRGADGKFRAMTEEEKAAKEAAAAAAKKPDPVEDEIPADIKGRTRERMQELIKTVKEQAQLAEQHNALFGAIQDTGATPDEFANMISYMKAAHSNDPKLLEKAYTLLQSELKGISIRLGKPVPEVNLLNDPANKDLVDDVRANKLSVQRAHELAAVRAKQAADAATAQRTTAASDRQAKETAEAKEAGDAGRAELNKIDLELRKRDGDATFEAKYDVLVPMLQEHFNGVHPSQWGAQFRRAYDSLKVAPKAAAVVPHRQQPLRPKAPAGHSGGGAPKSALEAISQALDGV